MPSLIRAVVLFMALSLGAVFGAAPTITVPTAAPGANGTAILSVNVTANGAETTVVFNYGTTISYGSTASVIVPGTAVLQPTAVSLTGLIGGQTYHFQVTATNSDGAATPSTDQTFVVPPYATTGAATTVAGTATLTGTVSAFGVPGNARFEYGLTNLYGPPGPTANQPLTGASTSQGVTAVVTGLTRNTTYHYRVVFTESGGAMTTVVGEDKTFITNNAPVANADTISAAATGPTTILPLVNDRDPDSDMLSLVNVTTPPEHGTAVASGNTIIYTPDGTSTGFDTFTYTIKDIFGLTAVGTISVRSIRAAFAGTHGGFIKRANGKEAGYFNVTATASGSFSGIAIIDGKRFVVSGTISADGVYRGFAREGNSAIPVTFLTDQDTGGSSMTVLFDNGRWASELTLSPSDRTERPGLAGRYTAGISAGGSGPSNGNDPGTPPEGTGWVAIRVTSDANAAIKGRLTDGRSFSTKGTVNYEDGVATLTFYDDPEFTRVIGNLTLGETVGGTVHTDRTTTGEGFYPRGYDITQGVNGARYVKPRDGDRVLDTATSKGQDLTISFSGGGLGATLTRDLYLNDRDNVKVLNPGPEDLDVRIDRKSGRFRTKFEIGTEGKKLKATGVLIQATGGGPGGSGTGTFETSFGTGTVTISATSTGGGTPAPAPTPTPLPTPEPTVAP